MNYHTDIISRKNERQYPVSRPLILMTDSRRRFVALPMLVIRIYYD